MKSLQTFRLLLNAVKRSTIVLPALLLLIITLIQACSNEQLQVSTPPPPSLPVMSVNTSSETTYLEYPAAIQGEVDLDIRPQVSGYIDKIFVNEGQLVSKGQPLFKINEQPFREQLNNAKASYHAAQAAILNAQLEVDKLTPLVQNKVVSDFQLKTAKTALQIATANAEQAKAGLGAAQVNLNFTMITAPVNGYVGRMPKKQGSLVSPADQQALTQLSDVHQVHVYFALSESDYIDFNNKYGKSIAQGGLTALPGVTLMLSDESAYPIKGKIDMIDGQFDKTTGSITLRASFANTKGFLRSGNTGKIRLSLQHSNALMIPQAATVEVQDKIFVYTVSKDNKITKQPVTVLGTSGTSYLLKDGLVSGDRIVTRGFENLKDGDVIKPEAQPVVTAFNATK
ncbi:efflux RND transporter periplasmic adaptor subunit [Pedobacter duraquae]|uniref:Membrane fusion protein (Multidrug efflux system) n=1 Tax=Pedobacter duraquae TaxID=425511 RepID=A0A4R6IRG5_9SPHI|nr:efflux RND transporter periplasmic adaptor subunit [Pedobacter duraquae]TDO24801.1 membrane fusion protein (multidrug efflux system) [Pedobacter duraquae]